MKKMVLVFFFFVSRLCMGEESHSLAKEVNWKLLFNKLFALEIKKESRKGRPPFKNTMALLKEHTSWSPLSFEEVIAKTLEAKTSREAYKIREKIYRKESNYRNIRALDFSEPIPVHIRRLLPVQKFLNSILKNSNREVGSKENFFSSIEGKNMMNGITWGGTSKKAQKVLLFLVMRPILSSFQFLKK